MKLPSVVPKQTDAYIDRLRPSIVFSEHNWTAGQFECFSIKTAYQPIFSVAHKRIVGYEALARATDTSGKRIPPASLFDREMPDSEHIFLDRLCRYIHVANFQHLQDDLNWLFLNISPKVVAGGLRMGRFFADLLEVFSFPSHRVVIEIIEHPITDQSRLLETVAFYRELGCLIAIDDFGAGHSNFERIWTIHPNIVKLDRSMMVQASADRNIRQLLPGIISLLHQTGALVVAEGVETADQALIAMESDADFVQGYYFRKPSNVVEELQCGYEGFDDLFGLYKVQAVKEQTEMDNLFERYKAPFAKAIWALKNDQPLLEACLQLMQDPSVVRCYLLGPDGIQIGSTISSTISNLKQDHRFDPLADANSADWFRRHYLRRAVLHPQQLQITRPYLSITGSHMCVTLSMMCPTSSGKVVLCCDLNRSN